MVFYLLAVTAFAETELDLSSHSADELIELQKKVDEALYAQDGKVVLPPGELVVGVDIAPGSYLIEPHNIQESYMPD